MLYLRRRYASLANGEFYLHRVDMSRESYVGYPKLDDLLPKLWNMRYGDIEYITIQPIVCICYANIG